MSGLTRCSACGGFVPANHSACPNCDRSGRLGRAAKACLKLATGSAVAMTLMACYGGPPHAYEPVAAPPEPCQNTNPNAPNASNPGSPANPSRQCSGTPPANTLATGAPSPGPAPMPGPPGS